MVATVKSENVTNVEASPITILDRKQGHLIVQIDQDAILTTSLDEVNDLMLFCPIPSNAVILDVQILNDDLDSNGSPLLAVDCGLAYSGIGGSQTEDGNTSGAAIDVDLFASASTALQAANTAYSSLRFEADDIIDIKKEAWSAGGLSADPGGLFYISLKVTAAAGTAAAGDVVVKVSYL